MSTTYLNTSSIFSITKIVFPNVIYLIWRLSKSVGELPLLLLTNHDARVPCPVKLTFMAL